MGKVAIALTLCLLCGAAAHGAIQEREVAYRSGEVALKGLLAFDDARAGRRPAILVVHEWWGHDEHARNSARRLAAAGYVALAVDMYGEGRQAHHPRDAAKLRTFPKIRSTHSIGRCAPLARGTGSSCTRA